MSVLFKFPQSQVYPSHNIYSPINSYNIPVIYGRNSLMNSLTNHYIDEPVIEDSDYEKYRNIIYTQKINTNTSNFSDIFKDTKQRLSECTDPIISDNFNIITNYSFIDIFARDVCYTILHNNSHYINGDYKIICKDIVINKDHFIFYLYIDDDINKDFKISYNVIVNGNERNLVVKLTVVNPKTDRFLLYDVKDCLNKFMQNGILSNKTLTHFISSELYKNLNIITYEYKEDMSLSKIAQMLKLIKSLKVFNKKDYVEWLFNHMFQADAYYKPSYVNHYNDIDCGYGYLVKNPIKILNNFIDMLDKFLLMDDNSKETIIKDYYDIISVCVSKRIRNSYKDKTNIEKFNIIVNKLKDDLIIHLQSLNNMFKILFKVKNDIFFNDNYENNYVFYSDNDENKVVDNLYKEMIFSVVSDIDERNKFIKLLKETLHYYIDSSLKKPIISLEDCVLLSNGDVLNYFVRSVDDLKKFYLYDVSLSDEKFNEIYNKLPELYKIYI